MKQENPDTSLTTNDIHTMIQLIDVCASRGAIRGDELILVGNIRSKLKDIVKEPQGELGN